jgi:hypothetical protein
MFAAAAVALGVGAGTILADEPALRLHAAVVGAATDTRLTIELLRWSTDTEGAPLLAALSAPPAPPAPATPAIAGGRAAGRGGRGRGAAPPLTPAARLAAAIKAAPTVGFIWGDGPTGYSIKYAWHGALPDGHERVVLVTDRRLGAHVTTWPMASGGDADADFAVIEMRLNDGAGEGKASLATNVVVDAAAKTVALEAYNAAPVLLKVTR